MGRMGIHATQWAHGDTTPTSGLCLIHAVAPYTDMPPVLEGCMPAISVYTKHCRTEMITDKPHARGAAVPMMEDMPPMLNRTRAGAPRARNTTCFQETARTMP